MPQSALASNRNYAQKFRCAEKIDSKKQMYKINTLSARSLSFSLQYFYFVIRLLIHSLVLFHCSSIFLWLLCSYSTLCMKSARARLLPWREYINNIAWLWDVARANKQEPHIWWYINISERWCGDSWGEGVARRASCNSNFNGGMMVAVAVAVAVVVEAVYIYVCKYRIILVEAVANFMLCRVSSFLFLSTLYV